MSFEQDIRKQAGNCLYCYINDRELTATNFGRHLPYIARKREEQLRYIKGLATARSMSREQIFGWISNEISKIYQPLPNPNTGIIEPANPKAILYALANGESVNGIDWNAGIYGKIGKRIEDNFGSFPLMNGANTSMYHLDTTTGVVTNNLTGAAIKGTPTYTQKGLQSMSYYDAANKVTLQANVVKGGKYSAFSASDGTNTIGVDGKAINASNGELWTNIYNMLAGLSDLISTLASYLSGVSAQSLSPVQVDDGWAVEQNKSTSNAGLVGVLGAGLIVGGILLSDDNNKKKTKSSK